MRLGYHHGSFRERDDDRPLFDTLRERAQRLDAAGFSILTAMDHFWQLSSKGYPDEPFLDCYATLTAVAAVTDAIELSALVTCPHYRNPGYLARIVASLDAISGGRAVFGIGSGWYEDEYEAIGVPFPEPSTRNRQMRDVIRLCRTAWTEPSPVTYDGTDYGLDGLYLDPKPEDIPVMIGGAGEQLTLRAVAEYADRWNVGPLAPDALAAKLEIIDEYAATYDRSVSDVRVTMMQDVVLRPDHEAAHAAYETLLTDTASGPTPRAQGRGMVGTPAEMIEWLASYRDVRLDTLLVRVPLNDRRTIELLIDEVLPYLPTDA